MGKAHSNAYRQALVFPDLPYQPELKVFVQEMKKEQNSLLTIGI